MQKSKRGFSAGRLALVGALFGLLSLAFSATGDSDPDPFAEYRDEVERGEFSYDASLETPWIEHATEVLALPAAGDLRPIELADLPEGMELLVDKSRIDVNPDDRVVRVWLWIRSRHGVDKGSFEGFRCSSREYKVYAYANPGRTPPVTKTKRPLWRSAKRRRPGDYRAELMHDYFCDLRGARSPDEIRQAMTGQFEPETFLSN